MEKPEIVCEDYLNYLDDLRESGATNMFGAGEYLVDTFDLSETDARTVLSYWMKSFATRENATKQQ